MIKLKDIDLIFDDVVVIEFNKAKTLTKMWIDEDIAFLARIYEARVCRISVQDC